MNHKLLENCEQLSPENIVETFKMYQKTGNLEYKEKILKSYTKLIFNILEKRKDYVRTEDEQQEVVQLCLIQISNSIEKFDLNMTGAWSTFVYHSISGIIQNSIRTKVKLSRYLLIDDYINQEDDVNDCAYSAFVEKNSLYGNDISTPYEKIRDSEDDNNLKESLNKLDYNDREFITKLYGIDREKIKAKDLAKELKVTDQAISAKKDIILKKLRNTMTMYQENGEE